MWLFTESGERTGRKTAQRERGLSCYILWWEGRTPGLQSYLKRCPAEGRAQSFGADVVRRAFISWRSTTPLLCQLC